MSKEKHSAYRSMKLGAEGKTKPTTKANKGALQRWTDEEWLNLNALKDLGKELPCGTKYKGQKEPTVCRPKYKINENEYIILSFCIYSCYHYDFITFIK